MRDIWIISDTHFSHSNILNFEDNRGIKFRGELFKDYKEMDEHMIQNWNQCVKPGDIVYHLGDVFMGDKERFTKLWPRLMGSKRLIVGNHDDIPYLSSGGFFKKVMVWRKFLDFDMILTHIPMQLDRSFEGKSVTFNIHGHIHQNKSPTIRHFNASVENIEYTPIHIESLAEMLKKRKATF